VLDMNDRALRDHVTSLGGVANGFPRQTGFDITVASEVMAILCLAKGPQGPGERLGDMIVAYRRDKSPIYCRDIKADGAMTVLLKDAMQPNLVQTLENNPAFVHGGPFANIAHGCNSVIATKTALKLADYVVTEAGLRRRSGRREVHEHQVPQGGPAPVRGGDRRHRARDEDERRRGQGRSRRGERRGGEEGLRQPRPPYPQREKLRRAGRRRDQPFRGRHRGRDRRR
jgi:hypothetical protein